MKNTFKQFPSNMTNIIINTVRPVLEELITAELTEMLSELSFSDLVGGGGESKKTSKRAGTSKRLPRRSAEEIDAVVGKIITLLKRSKEGLRAEDIRKELRLDVRELPRVIRTALADKKIAILSGEKRSTTYGVKKAKKSSAPKKAKKSAPKKAKKAKKKATPAAAE